MKIRIGEMKYDSFGCIVIENEEVEVIVIKKLHPLSDVGAVELASILLKQELEKR